MIGIYKITNPNERIYIGQSINIEKRFKSYKCLDNCKNQKALYASFLKYGVENHFFEIIETCEVEFLNIKERYWQDFYNATSNFNLNCRLTKTNEKNGKGRKQTIEEIKNRVSKIIGKKRTLEYKKYSSEIKKGSLNPMYGKKIKESSKELQRQKISGESNYLSKIILNTETGIFYFGPNEASKSIGIKKATLHVNITKNKVNKTNFIYV
jgi:group I intron endonuclease